MNWLGIIASTGIVVLVYALISIGIWRQHKQRQKMIDHIKSRYPKWIITFEPDGTAIRTQINSAEELEAFNNRVDAR